MPLTYMRLDFLNQSPNAAPSSHNALKQAWWAVLFTSKPKPEPPKQQFDPSAQNAIFYAQSEAKRRGAARVDTEHLLIGILKERNHTAARALETLHLDREIVFAKIDAMCPPGTSRMAWSHDLAPRAKRAFAYAFAEARELKDTRVGVEHLFLGLVREGEGKAACALDELGLDLDQARQAVRSVKSPGVQDIFRRWWGSISGSQV